MFYTLTFLFVVAAAGVVFYSSGFRIDFKNQIITETGGIYIKSEPSSIQITLNGKPIKNDTGIFRSGTLIDNLTPGGYVVTVSKDNFYNWQKNASVEPGAVSVFDSIVLVPENGAQKVGEAVDNFYLQNGKFVFKKNGALTFEGSSVVGDSIVNFTKSGSIISYSDKTKSYHLSNIFDLDTSLNLNVIFNNLKEARLNLPGVVPIVKIEPYPFNDRRFVIMTGRALYTIDTEKLEIEQVDSQANDFVVADNNIFWVNSDGVFRYNLLFKTASTISSLEDLNISSVVELKADDSGNNLALLTGNSELIMLDVKTKGTSLVSKASGNFEFGPDGKLLAFVENGSTIRVYHIAEDSRTKKLYTLFSLPGTLVDSIAWYDGGSYVFVKDSSKNLRFIEIDDKLPINAALISGGVADFVYDREEKALYFNTPSGLWKLGL